MLRSFRNGASKVADSGGRAEEGKEDDSGSYFLRGWPRWDTVPDEGSRATLQKDILRRARRGGWREQEKKDKGKDQRERKRSLRDSSLYVGGEEAVCRRNGCLGWGRTRLEGRPEDEDRGGRGRSAPTYTSLNRYTFDLW